MADKMIIDQSREDGAAPRIHGRLLWGIVLVGIILRLARYLDVRSLWLDESYLALNLVDRSFAGLLKPLVYSQYGPLGFIMTEKLTITLLGNHELTLRLFPLLAGVASLFFFHYTARKILRPGAALVAMGFFAVSNTLIYYSSEMKQYSTDVLVAVLLLALVLHFQSRGWSNLHLATFALVGGVTIWFSITSWFILAGLGGCLMLFSLADRTWGRFLKFLTVSSFWLGSFTFYYFLHVLPFKKAGQLWYFDKVLSFSFSPPTPFSLDNLLWYLAMFRRLFSRTASLPYPYLAAVLFLVGCFTLFRRNRRLLLLLTSPILVVLVISSFRLYPFFERWLLFTVPALFMLIAEGAESFRQAIRPRLYFTSTLVVVALFFQPVLQWKNPAPNHPPQEIKPVMAHIKDQWQEGDVVYLYHFASYPFRYYAERYGFEEEDYIRGLPVEDNPERYTKHLYQLRDRGRVWALFTHYYFRRGVEPLELYQGELDKMGKRVSTFAREGAVVYLYQMDQAGY